MAGSKALGDVSRLPLIGQPIIRGVFDIAGTHANPVQDALSFINPFD